MSTKKKTTRKATKKRPMTAKAALSKISSLTSRIAKAEKAASLATTGYSKKVALCRARALKPDLREAQAALKGAQERAAAEKKLKEAEAEARREKALMAKLFPLARDLIVRASKATVAVERLPGGKAALEKKGIGMSLARRKQAVSYLRGARSAAEIEKMMANLDGRQGVIARLETLAGELAAKVAGDKRAAASKKATRKVSHTRKTTKAPARKTTRKTTTRKR